MEQRAFGRTGMKVGVLGFGGAEIGFQNADLPTVEKLLNSALDQGLNVIDTAECYAASEDLIGRAVASRRQEFYLFTKTGHMEDGDHWNTVKMSNQIDRSLQNLRVDYVDLIQLHSCDEEKLRAGDVIGVLERARETGKTRFIGYSGDGQAARYAVESGRFDALQTSVNIADQEAIELTLPLAREKGLGVIAKRPIANAAWKTGSKPANAYHQTYWERLKQLDYSFLTKHVDAAVSIALRFTLAQRGVDVAIVGTRNPERWSGNAALLEAGPLPEETIEAIRKRWKQIAPPDWTGQT